MDHDNLTIYALASGAGRAGIAVVRISGPAASGVLRTLIPLRPSLPPPRVATRAILHTINASPDADAEVIDDALALWFPGPASFTGEDVVELHVHGGQAVLDALFASLAHYPGVRPAAAGEFSKRAFLNGKMDLTAVEAVADLVDAETAAQRRQALAQMSGALARLYDGWRERLIKAMAFAEATIDFAEEDIPDSLVADGLREVAAMAAEIHAHLADAGIGERIRSGLRITLSGAPNVGKSSLLNALAKRDVAIVSDIAGTTRDVIEVPLDLAGFAATVIDTAGLRETADSIESEGVRRAREQAAAADIRVYLLDATVPAPLPAAGDADLLVVNKGDVVEAADPPWWPADAMVLSAKTGAGLAAFIEVLSARVKALASARATESPPLTRARHRAALNDCVAALERVNGAAQRGGDIEMMAEDMRLAAQALGRITGRIDVEDLLDRIFRDFCIGK